MIKYRVWVSRNFDSKILGLTILSMNNGRIQPFRRVKDHRILLHDSPHLKNTCVRQVVLVQPVSLMLGSRHGAAAKRPVIIVMASIIVILIIIW